MLYKFKSKVTADLIMLEPHGDALMRVLGREPAAQGIVEVAAMPAALAAIERAVAEDEAARQQALQAAEAEVDGHAEGAGPATPLATVSLRQRLWPMVELLRRAQAAREPVVWGV